MLNTKLIPINQYINTIPSAMDRKKILSIAMGIYAGRKSHLPSNEVDSVNAYYEDSVKASVFELIYGFNEQIVIDTLLTAEIAKGYYKIRYSTLYPELASGVQRLRGVGLNYCGFFDLLNKVNIYVSKENYDYINNNGNHIEKLLSLFVEFDKS